MPEEPADDVYMTPEARRRYHLTTEYQHGTVGKVSLSVESPSTRVVGVTSVRREAGRLRRLLKRQVGIQLPKSDSPITFRLPLEDQGALSGLCVMDNWTLAEELRRAVHEYIHNRRTSPTFKEELANARARQDQALGALEGDANTALDRTSAPADA